MKIFKMLCGFVRNTKQESVNHNPVPTGEIRTDGFYQGWVGVDLDGTLAKSDRVVTLARIGEPIPKMAELVRSIIKSGVRVKIFTARAGDVEQVQLVKSWLRKIIFPILRSPMSRIMT